MAAVLTARVMIKASINLAEADLCGQQTYVEPAYVEQAPLWNRLPAAGASLCWIKLMWSKLMGNTAQWTQPYEASSDTSRSIRLIPPSPMMVT